jgi:hypothetical protein
MSDANNRRHPESTFEAEYPYNQSTITRSGHEIHVNDTPDKESLRVAHTKGSYVEIDKAGRTVVNSVGKAYYYMCDGFSTTVDGHYDVKVKGVMNVNVDGSVSEQTQGNRYMAAGENFQFLVGGALTEAIAGDKFDTVNGDTTIAVKGSEYKNIGAKSATNYVGPKTEVLNSNWSVNSDGNIEVISKGNIRFVCKNFEVLAETITLKTKSGDVTIDSQGQVLSTSQSKTEIQGSNINILSSGQTEITSSGPTTIVGNPLNLNP